MGFTDVLTGIGSFGFPIVMALLMWFWVQRFFKVLENRDDRFTMFLKERDDRFERVLNKLDGSIYLQSMLIARWSGQSIADVQREIGSGNGSG